MVRVNVRFATDAVWGRLALHLKAYHGPSIRKIKGLCSQKKDNYDDRVRVDDHQLRDDRVREYFSYSYHWSGGFMVSRCEDVRPIITLNNVLALPIKSSELARPVCQNVLESQRPNITDTQMQILGCVEAQVYTSTDTDTDTKHQTANATEHFT